MKSIILLLSATLMGGCQLISPILTNYNGVRMDVAHYINHSWYFGLKEREILVKYAKAQQQVTAWPRLSTEQQQQLAQQRLIGRWCSEQKITPKKLDLIDYKIFADHSAQEKLQAMKKMQQTLSLNLANIDCHHKF